MNATLYTARWVIPVSTPPIRDGAVLVVAGRIAAVGRRDELADLERGDLASSAARRVELGDAALLPGFVDVHTHLELTVLRGYLEVADFFTWIRRLTRAKYEVLDRDDLLASALAGAIEALRSGVTTVGEVCDIGVAREALERAGLRAVLFQEVFGPDPRDASARLEGLRAALSAHREALRSDRITLGVSPHAPYTVSAPLFSAVAALAGDEGLPISIHTAESRAERELLLSGQGAFADFLRSRGIDFDPPRISTVAWLERLGVLEARPLLVHGVHCDAADIDRIARRDASLAHCPKSNAKLGHGIAPIGAFIRAGVRVGLGTDSVASNNVLDPLDEARVAALGARARAAARGDGDGSDAFPAARDVLRLATLDSARALGLDREIGSLEPGKRADLVAIDLRGPHVVPVYDPEAAVLWSARASDVVLTLVGGDVAFENGRFPTLDPSEIRAALLDAAGRLARAGTE